MLGWFEFTKKEQIGIWTLCVLIAIGLSTSYIISHNVEIMPDSQVQKLDSLILAMEIKPEVENNSSELFKFNPNTISIDSLIILGLDYHTAARFVNYRAAIGGFEHTNQIKKVYGLSDSIFQLWDSSRVMVFDRSIDSLNFTNSDVTPKRDFEHSDKAPASSAYQAKKKTNPKLIVELNSALKEDLVAIGGIGNVLSERIIKYRDFLGGFVKMKQLYEVYGVDSNSLYLNNISLVIDSTKVKKLNINSLSAIELMKHPYVDKFQAKLVVAYKDQHGAYKSVNDILKCKAFSKDELIKLRPYILIE